MLSRIKTLATVLALAVAALPAVTEAPDAGDATAPAEKIGPVVGEMAPALDHVTPVIPAGAIELEEAEGTVLVFFRSADWCPYCQKQLVDLRAAAQPLADAGWRLAALSYDDVATLERFAGAKAINFTLLSDPGSKTIDAFGLRNHDVTPGSRVDGIPHPAIVFVREDGRVAAVLREEGYTDRPEIEVVLETAEHLNAVAGG